MRKDEFIKLRCTKEFKTEAQQAAKLDGRSLGNFVTVAILEKMAGTFGGHMRRVETPKSEKAQHLQPSKTKNVEVRASPKGSKSGTVAWKADTHKGKRASGSSAGEAGSLPAKS
jgi:hypothetical protein